MKRCPECRRDYYDDSLLYCLDDGSALLEGPASGNEPSTAILHSTEPPSEAATRAQIHMTEPADGPSSEYPPVGKVFGKRFVVAPLLLVAIALAAFFGYQYFASARSKQIESIAVMPFVNDSGDAGVEYLSDGMTETLISRLSQLPSLNVKPRSLVFRYKGKDVDPQTVGKELGVEAILSGRLVARGGDISLFAELVDVASTKVLWSRQYNRTQADLVSLQSEIGRDVSGRLRTALSGEEQRKVIENGTDNPEAYRLYLLARSLAERRKEKDVQKATENFQKAIDLDPNYALAYLGLARAYQFTAIYGNAPADEALTKSRAAILRALEIDPDMPEGHLGLASTHLFLLHDFAAAEREVRRALELAPELPEAHRFNGLRLAYPGHLDEALAEFKKAVDLDPMSPTARMNHAWCLFYMGRFGESDAELKAVQELDPTYWFAEYQMFINSRQQGDLSTAAEHLARAQDLRDEPEAGKFLRDAFKNGGWKGMIHSALNDPEKAKVWDYYLASFAAELGYSDRAFALLDSAVDKYSQFALFAKIDHAMDPLRGDPRYDQVLKKLGVQ